MSPPDRSGAAPARPPEAEGAVGPADSETVGMSGQQPGGPRRSRAGGIRMVDRGARMLRWLRTRWHASASGKLGLIGAAMLLTFGLVAVLAPLIAPYDPGLRVGEPFDAPTPAHPLGTNDVGQDILSELIFGARISLSVGILSALIAIGVGGFVGITAGFFRGATDSLSMRVVDITLALPFLPLLIVLAAFLGRSLTTTTLVIAAIIWAMPARVLRSQVLSLRERGAVESARAMGASNAHLLGRHILPNVSPLMISQFVRAANVAILLEASLAFLALGDPTNKSWGTMLYYANSRGAFLTDAWLWWVLPTGLAISLVVLGFAFVGYALEEWADPRLRSRRMPVLAQATAGGARAVAAQENRG